MYHFHHFPCFDVRSLYYDKTLGVDVRLWMKHASLACEVRGNRRYKISDKWPPERKEGYVLVCGTYVPTGDINEFLKGIN